uniref:Uncharacterized protein n=1 Tax=Anopheles culicifacies TaxID=139723 RepID=A0A182LZS3_9DIPT
MSTQSKRNLTANGGNVRRSQQPLKGDQLLCKCLEKGQEILRKVEELTVNPIRIRTVSRVSTHYQQQQPGAGATTPSTTVVTSSVMTQTHTTTNGGVGGGGGGGPKNNHAPVSTASVVGGLSKGGASHPVSDGRVSGAGEKKPHPSAGAGVTKIAGTGATGSGRSNGMASSNRVALTDSKRLSASTKASDSSGGPTIGRLCNTNGSVKGSPRLAGGAGGGGKSWPKPSALTVAPAPLKSPALVKQNKACPPPVKSLSSDNAVSSLIGGVDGNDSGKAKSLSTGALITTTRRTSLTPPTISLTVTDGSCPPLIITAPQPPPPTTTLMMATASSTKDSYHESDWSEDSGRMSNENLELFGGEPEKPLSSSASSSSTTTLPGKLNESLLGIFENSSSNGGVDGTVVIPAPTIHASAPYAGGRWNRSIGNGAPMRKKSSKGQIEQPIITINGDAGDEGDKVFFRSGVLGALEAKRDDLLSDRVIQLQAHCRGYLARRRLARRRLQELAVKCIQRNVRAFLKVRDWPWWRLLVRVTPLLAVHRTEEQLKVATVELQQVRAKLEKIEAERNELKATNHKLEARVREVCRVGVKCAAP